MQNDQAETNELFVRLYNRQIYHVLQQTEVSLHSKADDFLSDVSVGEIIASNNGAIAA